MDVMSTTTTEYNYRQPESEPFYLFFQFSSQPRHGLHLQLETGRGLWIGRHADQTAVDFQTLVLPLGGAVDATGPDCLFAVAQIYLRRGAS